MNIGIYQLIFIILTAMSLTIHLVKHGEPREENYNFFTSLISIAIEFTLLYLGGFFK